MSKALDLVKLIESALRLSITIESGSLLSESSGILGMSVVDPCQAKSREFFKYHNCSYLLTPGSFSFSKNRKYRLAIQEGEKKEDLFWELWNNSRILQVKDLKKIHTKLSGHQAFGRVEWSYDDRYALYIAEPIEKKSSSFWSGEENVGSANLLKDNFGEGLKHLTNPKLFVYDTLENTVKEIQTPDETYPAQPFFRPGTDEYVLIGYEKFGYKLGISAMMNRATRIYKKSISSEETQCINIPESIMAAQYPKFSPNGRYLSYYGVPKNSLCHSMCMSLHVYDFETLETKTILEVVPEFNEAFNGIYGFHQGLSTYDWLNNERIVFGTSHNASEVIFSTDLNGNVSEVDIPLLKPYSSSILDIYKGALLIKASNIKNPEQAYIATYENNNWQFDFIENTSQEAITPEEQLIKNALEECKIVTFSHKSSPVKSTLIYNSNNKNLIATIHGGPHTAGSTCYKLLTAARLATGFNELIINYRGSIGFGDSIVKELLTNIGKMDIFDCAEAINIAREITPVEKIVTFGGSHGGFLSLHLACEIPIDASVVLNGAVNIASMVLSTDITDWPFAEVLNINPVYPPTAEHITEMYKASPISRLSKIQCPVLLIAGGSDMRVPPSATMDVYRVLRANNKETKLFWYPNDGHGLLDKATTNDIIMNSLKWIIEVTSRTN